MYKLDELVRPFVHKILVVIEPLLIDKDYYARVEGNFSNIFPNKTYDEFLVSIKVVWPHVMWKRLQFTEIIILISLFFLTNNSF